jgi:hypothetical protein
LRARSEKGAVAVEAALVTPLLFALVLGIIEMALLMKDDVALSSAVRNGGRIASANAGAGPAGVAVDECVSPCTPSNAPMLAQLAAGAIQSAGTALPKEAIQELWVYKANNLGYPGATNSESMACGTNCVKYRWVPSKDPKVPGQFRYVSGTWKSNTINACANNNPDSVGVYMKAKHDFVSGLFGRSLNLDDHAVFTFEPLPTLTCAANQHL